jgi:hypothetical protein
MFNVRGLFARLGIDEANRARINLISQRVLFWRSRKVPRRSRAPEGSGSPSESVAADWCAGGMGLLARGFAPFAIS